VGTNDIVFPLFKRSGEMYPTPLNSVPASFTHEQGAQVVIEWSRRDCLHYRRVLCFWCYVFIISVLALGLGFKGRVLVIKRFRMLCYAELGRSFIIVGSFTTLVHLAVVAFW